LIVVWTVLFIDADAEDACGVIAKLIEDVRGPVVASEGDWERNGLTAAIDHWYRFEVAVSECRIIVASLL